MYEPKVCTNTPAPLWRRQQPGRVPTPSLCGTGESCRRSATTIDILPDDVLLEIFDSYGPWEWHLLAHVCRKWRRVVFASPHRLKLQILCTHNTRVRKNLDIWPAFPVVIYYRDVTPDDEDDVIAALEQSDRVCDVKIYMMTGPLLGKMAAVMQDPFPVLTHLHIFSFGVNAPVLPANFLGGYAPSLQEITLSGTPFPTLPTLLLSTNHLATLSLSNVPPTGYISPEAMVACLAALPRLESLTIAFQSATPRPDRIRPPPATRTVLPALISFEFRGASEYLEDLVARIDSSPQLDRIFIRYLSQLVDFRVAQQLSKFIDRSVGPKSTPFSHAQVSFFSGWVSFTMYRYAGRRRAMTTILCEGIDWRVSHIAQVITQFSAALSNVVHLRLEAGAEEVPQSEGTADVEWLHLLRQFPIVQTLRVSQELAGHFSLALEDMPGGMVAEALPSLDLLYLEDQPASLVEKFVAARRFSGCPVTVVDTETEFDERLESYVSK